MSGKGAAELTAAGKNYTFSDLALACEAAAAAAATDLPDILPAASVSEEFAAGKDPSYGSRYRAGAAVYVFCGHYS